MKTIRDHDVGSIPQDCPYPGIEPFTTSQSKVFCGRKEEIDDLTAQLLRERIVVLHGPTGSGKSSLINAGLIPNLESKGFTIFPDIRVGKPLPKPLQDNNDVNQYLFNLLKSLDSRLKDQEIVTEHHSATEISYRLENIKKAKYSILLLDQFEEIFTSQEMGHKARIEFFSTLGTILRDKSIWALISLREERVGELDKYSRLIPTHLESRYFLEYLTRDSAESAIVDPVKGFGIEYKQETVDRLLLELGPKASVGSGEAHIDPLYLQLVCVKIWNNFVQQWSDGKHNKTIDNTIAGLTDDSTPVQQALVEHINDAIHKASSNGSGSLSERHIRNELEGRYIERRGSKRSRRLVLIGKENLKKYGDTLGVLSSQHLLKSENRSNETWYELAHDRLIQPLIDSNIAWFSSNKVNEFERLAWEYCRKDRPLGFAVAPLNDIEQYKKKTKASENDGEDRKSCEEIYLDYCVARIKDKKRIKTGKRTLALLSVFIIIAIVVATLVAININNKIDVLNRETARLTDEKVQLMGENRDFNIRRAASSHKWRLHDQGAAFLLSYEKERDPSKPGYSDKLPPALSKDEMLFTALSAVPFVRTLPVNSVGGNVKSLLHADGAIGLYVCDHDSCRTNWIDNIDTEHRTTGDNRDRNRNSKPGTIKGEIALSNDKGTAFAYISSNRVDVCNKFGSCKQIQDDHLNNIRIDGPHVWGGDPESLILFLESGGGLIYSVQGDEMRFLRTFNAPDANESMNKYDGTHYTAAHIKNNMLLLGDEKACVYSMRLDVESLPKTVFSLWKNGWPHDAGRKQAKPKPEIAEIVSLFLKDDKHLLIVHQGAIDSAGGRIFLYALSKNNQGLYENFTTSSEIILDEGSRRTGELLAGVGRSSIAPAGEKYVSASFSPGGNWLTTSGEFGSLYLWNLHTLAEPAQNDMEYVNEVYARDENNKLDSKEFRFAPRRTLHGLSGGAKQLLTGPGGNRIYAIAQNDSVRSWSMKRLQKSFRPHAMKDESEFEPYGRSFLYDIEYTPKHGFITSDNHGNVDTLILRQRSLKPEEETPVPSMGVLLNKSIRSLNVMDEWAVVGLKKVGQESTVHLFSLDGSEKHLKLDDPSCDTEGKSCDYQHLDGVWSAKINPRNSGFEAVFDLASGDYKGRVLFWDIADDGVKQNDSIAKCDFGNNNPVHDLAFHPDGRFVAIGTENLKSPNKSRLYIVDLKGEKCLPKDQESICDSTMEIKPCVTTSIGSETVGPKPPQPIHDIEFNHDGTRLAFAGANGMLREIGIKPDSDQFLMLENQTRFRGEHRGQINDLIYFTRKIVSEVKGEEKVEEILASTGTDGRIGLWSIDGKKNKTSAKQTGIQRKPIFLLGDGKSLLSLATNSDASVIAAGGSDGIVRFWNLNPRNSICDIVGRNLTHQEWKRYFPGKEDYRHSCTNLPSPFDLKKNSKTFDAMKQGG